MCLGKNFMTSYFCKWPSLGLKKQSWCWKIFSLINILTWHSHTTSSDWFLLSSRSCQNFDHLHVLSRKSHDVDFCLWLLSECNTKLWMLQFRIRKRTVFSPLGFDFLSCQINSLWFLVFFAYFHGKVFQILRKSRYGHWMYW